MSNPNVGKSALFTRLTGVHAFSSNYPGTTVGFTEGYLRFDGVRYRLIDVPGAYTLEPTNEAEDVAKRILEEGADVVVITVDATALERNLNLALQVLEMGLPSVIALNMIDEARHEGINIDVEALERALGVPVVGTVAVTGQGISELIARLRTQGPANGARRGALEPHRRSPPRRRPSSTATTVGPDRGPLSHRVGAPC